MILGIDASSTSGGGALIHLIQLLKNTNNSHFEKVIVWTNLNELKSVLLNKNIKIIKIKKKKIFERIIWQRFVLTKELKKYKCDILLCNSGYSFANFKKKVLIIQNYIPFKYKFILPYFPSFKFLKFLVLRIILKREMNLAKGIIFLNENIKSDLKKRFIHNPKCVLKVIEHSNDNIIKNNLKKRNKKKYWSLIYPSYIDLYKNHLNLISAINNIKNQYKIIVTFLGDADKEYLIKIKKKINKYKLNKNFIFKKYIKSRKSYFNFINNFDIAIFLSNCENFPKTLLEIMSLKIPLICSNETPMKEITKNYSIKCNQRNSLSIQKKIIFLIKNYEKIVLSLNNTNFKFNDETKMCIDTYEFLKSFK